MIREENGKTCLIKNGEKKRLFTKFIQEVFKTRMMTE